MRRIAEAQLDGREAAGEELLGLVGEPVRRHQAEPAAVVGGDRFRLAAEEARERQPRRTRERVPAGDVEPRHRHAHDALHADQGEPLGEPPPQVGRRDARAAGRGQHVLEHPGDRGRGGREVAEQIGMAGDAFLGVEVDQQQRRGGDGRAAGAERMGHRQRDRGGDERADGQHRRCGFGYHRGRGTGAGNRLARRPVISRSVHEYNSLAIYRWTSGHS
jgi:hypothetical protein